MLIAEGGAQFYHHRLVAQLDAGHRDCVDRAWLFAGGAMASPILCGHVVGDSNDTFNCAAPVGKKSMHLIPCGAASN